MRIIAIVVIFALLVTLFTGCASEKTIDGVTYDTYGFFNEDDNKNPNIHYEASVGSVIVGILFVETIIIPVYIFGFDFMEPTMTEAEFNAKPKGVIE